MSHFKLKEVPIPIYRGNLIIIFTDDSEKLANTIELDSVKEIKSIYCHTMFANRNGEQGIFLVFNFKNKNRAVTHGSIAHEAIHAANFLFGDRGIVLDADNDEAFAYFVEWVVDQVYAFARECKFH